MPTVWLISLLVGAPLARPSYPPTQTRDSTLGVIRPFRPEAGRHHLREECVREAAVLIGCRGFGNQQDNRVDAIDSVMPWSGIDEIEPSLAVVSQV